MFTFLHCLYLFLSAVQKTNKLRSVSVFILQKKVNNILLSFLFSFFKHSTKFVYIFVLFILFTIDCPNKNKVRFVSVFFCFYLPFCFVNIHVISSYKKSKFFVYFFVLNWNKVKILCFELKISVFQFFLYFYFTFIILFWICYCTFSSWIIYVMALLEQYKLLFIKSDKNENKTIV